MRERLVYRQGETRVLHWITGLSVEFMIIPDALQAGVCERGQSTEHATLTAKRVEPRQRRDQRLVEAPGGDNDIRKYFGLLFCAVGSH